MEMIERIATILQEVRTELAPDPRLSVFEVVVAEEADALVLLGSTSEPAAAEALHRRVALLEGRVRIRDAIVRLPEERNGAQRHALVTAAIAPMLAGPLISEAHLSQTVLGQRLLVLRERGRWLQCRSGDGYIGWIHRGYVRLVDEAKARGWEIAASGEPLISLGAELRDAAGELVMPLPWGARVVRRADGLVALPDGRAGLLAGEAIPAVEQEARFPREAGAILETASSWTGAPYLWGGITPAGVDCSGLVQAVLRMHGVALPRDSDLQAAEGTAVEPGSDFSGLRPADLLFFAEAPGRISHVAFSLGGSGILHSSLGNGGVRRNDLLGRGAYEKELRRLLVCARRVLPTGS
jgi:gamma-D-glutamyl-L-lysine dipeptidyl-peptidase